LQVANVIHNYGISEKTITQKIFVSCADDDITFVKPIVQLLRINKSFIFQEIDSLEFGKRKQEQIDTALSESHLFVLFWCNHSNLSEKVKSEYTFAVDNRKDILPVIFDNTLLPKALKEFKPLDFRDVVNTSHKRNDFMRYIRIEDMERLKVYDMPDEKVMGYTIDINMNNGIMGDRIMRKENMDDRPRKSNVRYLLLIITMLLGMFIFNSFEKESIIETLEVGIVLTLITVIAFLAFKILAFISNLLINKYQTIILRIKDKIKTKENIKKMASALETEIHRRNTNP
jgi:hypothetical protein